MPCLLLIITENLVKYKKVSKCYVHDCLQSFVLFFMFFKTAPIVKNSQIYFIFLKSALDQT